MVQQRMKRKPSPSAAHKIRTPLHDAVIRAVGRLYNSHPGVKRMTFKRGKDGVFVRSGYTWYRESWMDGTLNAYEKLKSSRRLAARAKGK